MKRMSAALGPAFGYIGGAAQLTRWVDFDKGEVILNKQIFIDNIRKSQKSLELQKKYFEISNSIHCEIQPQEYLAFINPQKKYG